MRILKQVLVLALVSGAVSGAALAASGDYGPWSSALRVESIPGTDANFNGPYLDGCPFISRDGKTFYMARGPQYGGSGGIDIWVATRESTEATWGAPINVGAPVNSPANDFCPTISRDGHEFYFVSNRPGSCGGDDIYTTRLRPDGWDPVANLGCDGTGGPNSTGNEAAPFPIPEREAGPTLYPFLQQPRGRPGQRHLLRDARKHLRSVVHADQPRAEREQCRLGDAALTLMGRDNALFRLEQGRRRRRRRSLHVNTRKAHRIRLVTALNEPLQ